MNIEFSRRKILQPKRFAKGKNSYHYKKPIPNIPHPHPFTDHLLHLIQINHGNFPPRQVTRGQRGREGWGCWSGGEGGFRRMMTRIFRIVPCQGVLGKERGVFKAAGDRLRKFFVLNERKRKFSAAFIEFETLCCAIFCSLM